MVRFFRYGIFPNLRRGNVSVLAFALGFGFLAGSLLAALESGYALQLISDAARTPVSYGAILAVMALPVLFTVYAAFIQRPWMLILISCLKATAFSYLSACILQLYGEGAWLMLALLLFSDHLTLPLLCWIWIRYLRHGPRVVFRDMPAVILLLSGIVFLDYSFISPYLARLLS